MEPLLYYIKKLHSSTGKIIYFNVFGMAIVSLMEGFGILLIVPLLSIGGVIETNAGSSKLSQLFNFLTVLPQPLYLPLILCIYVVIIVGQNLLQRSLAIRDVKVREKFSRDLRIEIYSLLLHSKWALFLRKRKSTLINLLTAELARVIGGINFFLQLLSNTIFMVIQLAIALWLSVKMTLFIVLFGLILGYLSRKFVQRSRNLELLTKKHLAHARCFCYDSSEAAVSAAAAFKP
ncbi:ABC transporter transmembrane domain-containing protein, partial [Priestia megaterium]|uniref:ABC transporter transmembrane domain-containing protein n=1 Tax=Priestia megaterium TaxID=1404 RepID=UPI0033945EDB